jgi:hypothetical protein
VNLVTIVVSAAAQNHGHLANHWPRADKFGCYVWVVAVDNVAARRRDHAETAA